MIQGWVNVLLLVGLRLVQGFIENWFGVLFGVDVCRKYIYGFVGLGLAFFRVGLNFKGYLALVKFQVLLKVG